MNRAARVPGGPGWRTAILAAVAVGACGSACTDHPGGRAGAAEGADAARSRITVLYSGASEWVFSPSWDDSPKFLLFLPLVSYTQGWCDQTRAGLGSSGSAAGGLAESWERSDDWRSWTVRLRQGLRWHDGRPVTATDVEENVRLWKHPDVAWYAGAPVEEVQALDERTVRFTLRAPGRWPLEGWDTFYPAHLMRGREPRGFFQWDWWTRPVGNGPYRYVRHVPRTMVELEANPDYPLGPPAIERVVLQFAAGGESGLVELLAGKVDLLTTSNLLEADFLQADPRFRVYYSPVPQSVWLAWNHRHPVLGDPGVRRALTHALDRRALARGAGLPENLIPAETDGPSTACQRERGELAPPWPHDPAEARRLLDEAGWIEGRGGLRERDGRPLRFTLTTARTFERTAVLVQEQLRRVGALVDVRLLDDALVRRRFQEGDFEAALPRLVNPHLWIARADGPLGAVDSRLAELIAAIPGTPDPAEEDALYREIAALYRETLPATYLHPRMEALVAHRRVRGLGEPGGLVARPTWRWPFGGLEQLWIEEE